MVDSTRLRYFLVVAETGSIRRAAELLHITPAALSKAVKTLEAELATSLIEPLGRGITLTDEGRILATRARPIIQDLSGLADALTTRKARSTDRLRIASHEVFGTYFTKPLLDQFHPPIEFEHRYAVPGDIESLVLDGATDIGVSYIPVPHLGTVHRKIVEVPMGLYGRPRLHDVAFDELEFAAPVGPIIGSPIRAQGLDGWPDDTVPRRVTYRITHTESALELCRQGRAVAYFPSFVIKLHNAQAKPSKQLAPIPVPKSVAGHTQAIHVVTRVGEIERFGTQEISRALLQLLDP
jgi:DNA-binding transcriptional LysR family regulator